MQLYLDRLFDLSYLRTIKNSGFLFPFSIFIEVGPFMKFDCVGTALNSPNSSENGKKVRRRYGMRLADGGSNY